VSKHYVPVTALILAALSSGCGGPSTPASPSSGNTGSTPSGTGPPQTSSQPPLLLKTIGVNLDYFDPSTGRAGDFQFTSSKLAEGRIWMDFGFVIPGGDSNTGADKANPQPTLILPLGTPVHALVDGIVFAVPSLYSGDFSIQIWDGKTINWLYETEHVRNPLVKPGDAVRAGQVIAEVSTWSSQYNDGLGMVELGVLHAGNPPEHVCPFAYLDPSIQTETLKKINALYTAWKAFRNDATLYDETRYTIHGCLTPSAVPG